MKYRTLTKNKPRKKTKRTSLVKGRIRVYKSSIEPDYLANSTSKVFNHEHIRSLKMPRR